MCTCITCMCMLALIAASLGISMPKATCTSSLSTSLRSLRRRCLCSCRCSLHVLCHLRTAPTTWRTLLAPLLPPGLCTRWVAWRCSCVTAAHRAKGLALVFMSKHAPCVRCPMLVHCWQRCYQSLLNSMPAVCLRPRWGAVGQLPKGSLMLAQRRLQNLKVPSSSVPTYWWILFLGATGIVIGLATYGRLGYIRLAVCRLTAAGTPPQIRSPKPSDNCMPLPSGVLCAWGAEQACLDLTAP
jgi:hypothetical protein